MARTTKHTHAYKDATIQNIARDLLGLETLEARRRDSLDFHELSVWQIREALEAAFEAGRQTSR
ncbi:hypothetical protein HED60_23535 [Planctomycetales bacterium ZRK34]|nr:hypothetical protein HED60_23535 [Planctomycetales bacterium ZRK34]